MLNHGRRIPGQWMLRRVARVVTAPQQPRVTPVAFHEFQRPSPVIATRFCGRQPGHLRPLSRANQILRHQCLLVETLERWRVHQVWFQLMRDIGRAAQTQQLIVPQLSDLMRLRERSLTFPRLIRSRVPGTGRSIEYVQQSLIGDRPRSFLDWSLLCLLWIHAIRMSWLFWIRPWEDLKSLLAHTTPSGEPSTETDLWISHTEENRS